MVRRDAANPILGQINALSPFAVQILYSASWNVASSTRSNPDHFPEACRSITPNNKNCQTEFNDEREEHYRRGKTVESLVIFWCLQRLE